MQKIKDFCESCGCNPCDCGWGTDEATKERDLVVKEGNYVKYVVANAYAKCILRKPKINYSKQYKI